MDIHMEQHFGDSHSHWSMTFVSRGFEFTEADLTAVRIAVELPGVRGLEERLLQLLDQHDRLDDSSTSPHRGSWDRRDGLHRTNRISVSCTQGQRPGRTVLAYRALEQRYPNARFTMQYSDLQQKLTKEGLAIAYVPDDILDHQAHLV